MSEYKPTTYCDSINEIIFLKISGQLRYELRMVADQADNEVKNSTPNIKIEILINAYQEYIDNESVSVECAGIKRAIDDLKELISNA